MSIQRIDISEVQNATKALAVAYTAKREADKNLESVRGLVGQQGYAITIAGVRVAVADMDQHYNPKLIRGREMIHLGALKALQGIADHWEAEVLRREATLAALTRRGAA